MNVEEIKDPLVKLGYQQAMKDYQAEIALGKAILEVLDERYEFTKESYYE